MMNRTKNVSIAGTWFAGALVAIFLFIYILPLGWMGLFSPDETRYAEIPREMIASGDWVVPHLDGVRYFEKPVLGYWVHAASILTFGENNFAVRLPSALSVGLAAWIVFVMASQAAGGRRRFEAPLAALVFLTCAEVFGVGNQAVLDSLFSLFVTATVAAFWLAAEAGRGSARERGFLAAAGGACGLAFLPKGFLALAVPGLVLPAYLVWQKRHLDILRMMWIPATAAIAVSLPWSLAIHHREPDFWNFFFWNEHVRRFTGNNAQHSTPLWKFWLMAAAMSLPWLFVLSAAVPGVRKRIADTGARGRLIRLSICWAILPFLLFSLSKGKLITYILPCFPPFSILMSLGLSEWIARGEKPKSFLAGAMAGAVLSGLGLAGLVVVWFTGIDGVPLYARTWQFLLVGSALALGAFLFVSAFRSRDAMRMAIHFGLAPVALLFAIHFGLPDKTLESKTVIPFLKENRTKIDAGTILLSDATAVQAVCWQYRRSDVEILAYSGELTYGMKREEGGKRLLSIPDAAKRIERNRGHIVLITRARRYGLIEKRLPAPVSIAQNSPGGYVFVQY
jgi:4-amino-4-deoxy-L-arabinose transferase